MRVLHCLQWCPPASPLRIEIPSELLPSLSALAERGESCGVLYGIRHGREVRILAAHSTPGDRLQPVGIFIARIRGEVFLTEKDLESFEKSGAAIALVIAGLRAGFFVREADGSIQTVRSHEEFPLYEDAPAISKLPPAPLPRHRLWPGISLAMLAAIPVAALAYFRPPPADHSPALQVVEHAGQLLISWSGGRAAILEVTDASGHRAVAVGPQQSTATYQHHGKEVEITLVAMDGGGLRRQSTHFVGPEPEESSADKMRSQIAGLKSESARLRAESSARRERIAALEKSIAKLITQ